MTPKSKLYLKITIIALLIAAGSVLYHKYQNEKFVPPLSAEAAADTQGAAAPVAEHAEPEDIPPADMPRGWNRQNITGGGAAHVREEAVALEEKLQAFNKEMETAVAAIPQEVMMSSNAEEIFLSNPQIQKILLKYSKDPAFMQLMEKKMTADDVLGGVGPRGAQKTAKQK
jgi:hypothetical protein